MEKSWKVWKGSEEIPPFYNSESWDTIFNQIFEATGNDEGKNVEYFSNQILFFVEGYTEIFIGHYVCLENGNTFFRSNMGDDYEVVLFWSSIAPFPPSIFS